jgi:hypothetical protein
MKTSTGKRWFTLMEFLVVIASLIATSATSPGQIMSVHSDPAAEFVQINAEIELLRWDGGLGSTSDPRSQSSEIHAIVGRDKWVIGEWFPGRTNYYSFDGTKIFEWACSIGTDGSTGNPWTNSSESLDGNPGETVRVVDHLDMVSRIAWLAFCSAPTLNNPQHKLYPPWDFWKEHMAPATFVRKVARFEDDLGLPESLLIFSGDQAVVDYRVSCTTNVAGWFFPQGFYLLGYNPTGTNGWMLRQLIHGKVSSITPAADPFPPATVTRKSQGHTIRFAVVSPSSKIHVEGTSDVVDWSLDTFKFVGFLELHQPLFAPSSSQGSPVDLQAQAEFCFPVKYFGNGITASTFCDKTDQAVLHHVLRTTENPNIVYRLRHLIATNAPTSQLSTLVLQSTGEIVIGGVTNSVSIPIQISRREDGLRLSGSTSLKLSDFGIDPLLVQSKHWAVTVGDTVESSFDLQLKKVETP